MIGGRAELNLEGQNLVLKVGDCWLVPTDQRHSYSIL